MLKLGVKDISKLHSAFLSQLNNLLFRYFNVLDNQHLS